MKWEKKGLIYSPRKNHDWNQKYAILPTPVYIESSNVIRIFFGTTDNQNYGRISYLDVCADNPSEVLYEHDSYILDLGEPGTFDDCGVVPSCIIKEGQDNCFNLYTVGFQRTVKTPYMLFAGLAQSQDLSNFQRYCQAPILPRSCSRHISQGAPCVIYEDGIYKMWHWFATKWIEVDGKPFMDYHIGYAESLDAKSWEMRDTACLSPMAERGEFAVARPWVFKMNNKYHMYYSTRYKEKLYRIDYAVSEDGIEWERVDTPPFDVSEHGWDSEMICYPSIIEANGKTFMFYNGNNNGETGFGYAELFEEVSK
ncbi:hypothetical protein [Thiomicrorhabdus sediminis]|uniref:Glycosyl hydrolase family 32 N-terminal domain-containing protein n=1 Tax=Thiomicrorhabdus sediminis TaxID=2580412 RepID=A0A4V1HHM7_9GAMM|nr:hypothetical protein [Thiomicrorhabdus sediminis]QCU89563.1 hypothetical protein FE785_02380 [Thiomicrorhabdus sediminis]